MILIHAPAFLQTIGMSCGVSILMTIAINLTFTPSLLLTFPQFFAEFNLVHCKDSTIWCMVYFIYLLIALWCQSCCDDSKLIVSLEAETGEDGGLKSALLNTQASGNTYTEISTSVPVNNVTHTSNGVLRLYDSVWHRSARLITKSSTHAWFVRRVVK